MPLIYSPHKLYTRSLFSPSTRTSTLSMKSSTALFAWMAMILSIAAASKNKTKKSRNPDLPEFKKTIYSGSSLTADQFWTEEGCEESSTFEFGFTDGTSKNYPWKGKSSKSTNTYGYGELELFTDCNETSAIHTFAYFNVDSGAVSRFSFDKKSLKKASINVHTKTGMYIVESCTKFCDSDGYCYYTDCIDVTDSNVPVTVRASLTASDKLSKFRTKNTFEMENYINHYSAKSKERLTSVSSLTVTLDGKKMKIPKKGVFTNSYLQSSSITNCYEI